METFYLHRLDALALVPVFVAFLPRDGAVTLSAEHDASAWLPVREAATRLAWPRERRALEDAVQLFGDGSAGALEDVLRVC